MNRQARDEDETPVMVNTDVRCPRCNKKWAAWLDGTLIIDCKCGLRTEFEFRQGRQVRPEAIRALYQKGVLTVS